MQVAFQYSFLIGYGAHGDSSGASGTGAERNTCPTDAALRVQRRMRIYTVAPRVA
jgi:hypothetical protein